ncbi:hypothetical protein AAC387_Pa07g3407 [Persea americana]
MKILFWNCQGAGQSLAIRHLKKMVNEYCPDLIFLMETKARNNYMDRKRRKMRFQHSCLLPPNNRSGGLALFWSDPSQIQMINAFNNMIDVRILHPSSPNWWRLSCVCGHPNPTQRNVQWHDLGVKGSRVSEHWLSIGDFNDILTAKKKEGGIAGY